VKGKTHLELKEIDCWCREKDTVTRSLKEIKYESGAGFVHRGLMNRLKKLLVSVSRYYDWPLLVFQGPSSVDLEIQWLYCRLNCYYVGDFKRRVQYNLIQNWSYSGAQVNASYHSGNYVYHMV
jgi:hypothetical protein